MNGVVTMASTVALSNPFHKIGNSGAIKKRIDTSDCMEIKTSG